MDGVFNTGFENMHVGWQAWIYWMMAINTASIVFVKNHVPARVVLVVWLLNAGTMMAVAEFTGFTRILGLVHVVYWSPLLVYLVSQIRSTNEKNLYSRWTVTLVTTIGASLILDYIDVVRFILGDRD